MTEEQVDVAVKPIPEPAKHTEGSMLALLRARHAAKGGNGPEWAFVQHVRDASGFDAKRTIDAIALGLWPSRGHELHAFEVKVTRADWRRELKDPSKAESFIRRVDRFWMVAPRGVIPKDELPVGWGLLEPTERQGGSVLTATVAAALQEQTAERKQITRSWLVCLMRAAGTALASEPADVERARTEGYEKGSRAAEAQSGNWKKLYDDAQEQVRQAREDRKMIEDALGVSLHAWRQEPEERRAHVVAGLRAVLDGDAAVDTARKSVLRFADQLEQQATILRRHAEPPTG